MRLEKHPHQAALNDPDLEQVFDEVAERRKPSG
jgi:hypothetical protein